MSDNRTPLGSGNFSDDEDLQLAHPSHAQGVYGRAGKSKPVLLLIAALVFITLSSGLYYYAYQRGLEDGQNITPPVVAAEPGDMKVTAESAGEVTDVEPPLNIHGVMSGETGGENTKIILSESQPADNNNGALESLMPSSRRDANPSVEVGQPFTNGKSDETSPTNVVKRAETAPVEPQPKVEPKVEPAPAKPKVAVKPNLGSTEEDRYMVQLSASRSRALALASYEAAQKKHDGLLGRRSPLIFRADLGSKGVFYRVNVGGFRSKSDAKGFCTKLKARGQDCLVKNEPS